MVGKTTFALALVARLTAMGFPTAYLKFGMESRGNMDYEYCNERINKWCVVDRMYMSECIYATCTNREPSLSGMAFEDINERILLAGGMIVVITAHPKSYDVLIRKFHARGEDFDKATCVAVNKAYIAAANDRAVECAQGVVAKIEGVPIIRFTVKIDGEGEPWFAGDDTVNLVARKYVEQQLSNE